MDGIKLTRTLNGRFHHFFTNAFRIIRKQPGYFIPMAKHLFWQRRAAGIRLNHEKQGIHVPPFLIFSITKQCNLNCKGCYAKHLHKDSEKDLSFARIDEIIKEAEALGISIMLLAGGEPLIRKDILTITEKHPRMIFPIFTNGMLIDDAMAQTFARQKNTVPIVSIEGDLDLTDTRRGAGVYASITKTFEILRRSHAAFGTSITVTRDNFEKVTSPQFVEQLGQFGSRVVFYIEYIPCSDNSQKLVITPEQRSRLKQVLEDYRKRYGIIFIAFPGDEDTYGGCLAAGRGFVHISSSGRVEPCPFSPFSDISLTDKTLAEALKSRFLMKIRESRDLLSEHEGGCALWENRDWVERTLAEGKTTDIEGMELA